jgi:phosphosulfolactate phosphohydrolase-like enzyme
MIAQTKVLHQLQQNKNIVIKLSDKNLGPAVMDTANYIKQLLEDHLITKDYWQLTREEALNTMEQLKVTLKAAIHNSSPHLSDSELTYFK